jgi:HEAT repeat protein
MMAFVCKDMAMFHRHRSGCTLILLLALACTLMPPVHAQIKGPIEATVGDSAIKMEYGNNANAPTADEVVIPREFAAEGNEWLTTQWSWVTWWEANSYHYLQPAQPLKSEREGSTAARSALIATLQQAKDANVLAAAALALGRMQAKDASLAIIKLIKHESPLVRRNCWLALGLIADSIARKVILDVLDNPTLSPEDATAWIVAIGLMDKPDPKLLKALIPIIMQPNVLPVELAGIKANRNEALIQARMAMWALRIHNPSGVNGMARHVLDFTTDPMLYDQAIQTLATQPDELTVLNVFNAIYHTRPIAWRKLPKAPGLASQLWPGALESHNDLAAMRTSIALAYDNPAITYNKRLTHLVTQVLSRTYGDVPTFKRDSKQPNTAPRVYKFDTWRNHGDDMRLDMPDTVGYALRFGLIPLGKLGDFELENGEDAADAQLLCDILLGRYTQEAGYRAQDPSRGFAAMALGLYLRRLPSDSAAIRHDKLRAMARYIDRLLARTAADADEPSNLRAACVLALALSRTNTAAADIKQVLSDSAAAPDPILAGYATLALGMLHDPMTLQLAKQAFTKTSQEVDVKRLQQTSAKPSDSLQGTLIQRAIVQGMACFGEPKANVLLYPRLMDNPFTSRQIITAIKWSGDMQITAGLLQLLENPGNNPQNAAFSAWALGELYDPDVVSVLTEKLLRQRNITLLPLEKNTQIFTQTDGKTIAAYSIQIQTQPYLELTNAFLFEALITKPRG